MERLIISRTSFEDDFKASGNKDILVHRQRDVFLPPECRACNKIHLPKNPFDLILYKQPTLILAELKSTGQKSISLDEKIIKKHQSLSLLKFSDYKGVICGFIFNFREFNNATFFIGIQDFMSFVEKAERKSIPLAYCQEVGIEVDQQLKKTRYKYNILKLFNDINKKEKDNTFEKN